MDLEAQRRRRYRSVTNVLHDRVQPYVPYYNAVYNNLRGAALEYAFSGKKRKLSNGSKRVGAPNRNRASKGHKVIRSMPYVRSNRNRAMRKRKVKRRIKRRSKKPSKSLVKYIKNQISKPEWLPTKSLEQTEYVVLSSLGNKVTTEWMLGGLGGFDFNKIVAVYDGADLLSYANISSAGGVGVDLYDATQAVKVNKRMRFRDSYQFKIKNVSNATAYITFYQTVCTTKFTSDNTSATWEQVYGDAKLSTALSLKKMEDDFFWSPPKRAGKRWTIKKQVTYVVNAGESVSFQMHEKYQQVDLDKLTATGVTAGSYIKGNHQYFYRMHGELTHQADDDDNLGYAPSSLIMHIKRMRYASFIDADAQTGFVRLNVEAPTLVPASGAVVAEVDAPSKQTYDA